MINNFKKPKGKFHITCFDKHGKFKWKEIFDNVTTDQGCNDILDVYFSAGAQKTIWYLGLKGSNETPLITWTSASIGVLFTEFVAYDEAVRQTWVEAGVSAKSITNTASPASITVNSAGTLYGAFLISVNTKGGNTGILYCISNFATSRPVADNDVISIIYTVSSVDA